jgi:hypothetical protein
MLKRQCLSRIANPCACILDDLKMATNAWSTRADRDRHGSYIVAADEVGQRFAASLPQDARRDQGPPACRLIDVARCDFAITTPYFTPDGSSSTLFVMLRSVTSMFMFWRHASPAHRFASLAYCAAYEPLVAAGTRVHEYLYPGFARQDRGHRPRMGCYWISKLRFSEFLLQSGVSRSFVAYSGRDAAGTREI